MASGKAKESGLKGPQVFGKRKEKRNGLKIKSKQSARAREKEIREWKTKKE